MAEARRNTGYYTSGSAAYVQAPEKTPARRVQDEREVIRNARSKVEEKVLSGRESAREFTRLQVVCLTASIAVILLLSTVYVMQLSRNHQLKSKISSLKLSYETQVQENELLQNDIERALDLDAIYAYATNILEMKTPEKHQIVYYVQSASEYVEVNGEIPNE